MDSIKPIAQHDPIRLAVLVSGGGTTVQNLHAKIQAGQLCAELTVVICSNKKSFDIVIEKNVCRQVVLINGSKYRSPSDFSNAIFEQIRSSEADLVCLAGFLSLLAIPDEFVGRVLNIHPALLPAFGGQGMYGANVHKAVLASGCKVSGCTVHFTDQTYDTGPILLQKICPVQENDTPQSLAARVFEQECLAYPEAICLIADGRVVIEPPRTVIKPPPAAQQ